MMEQENQVENMAQPTQEHKPKKQSPILIILNVVLLVGLAVLYVLYFTGEKKAKTSATPSLASYQPIVSNEPGNGEVLFINMDTLQAYYALVDILEKDIDQDKKRLEASFANRQETFQQKVNQFQQNLQANTLTEQQAMNTEKMLTDERDKLEYDFEMADVNIKSRQLTALQQVMDSIVLATQIVNAEYNASYILSYQYGGQLIYADPTRDITKQVLDRLNAYYEGK
ncbi:MAG: OmpH family outer membrane protein [Bacteroidales bacterium]|jgi:Skp family chaperone for outer membrane proteins|nr:OmpH family outer membrane protein [Bacteroidales bacterium]